MLKTYAHAVARAQEHAAAVANDLLTRSGRFKGERMFRNIEKYGAAERIRTVDLRITSALSQNPTESGTSQESQNPYRIEISETEGKPEDP